MESIEDTKQEEKALLDKTLTKQYFDIHIWRNNSKDISDIKRLKLVIQTNQTR